MRARFVRAESAKRGIAFAVASRGIENPQSAILNLKSKSKIVGLMGCNLQFKTGQIVSLECENACLYAEVIQIVEARQICWSRPLMLAVVKSDTDAFDRTWEDGTLYDLREGADLLWPLNLFRAAVDVEVISLLTQLQSLDPKKKDAALASRQLREFVDRVWEAHPHAFS